MVNTNALRVVPLGGLGRVGGNMMVYETATDLWAVDCGVHFPGPNEPGIDWVVPDPHYLLDLQRRKKFRGYILTHGHEDHLGALRYLLPELPGPVWGTAFTLAILKARMEEYNIEADLRLLKDGERLDFGNDCSCMPLPITHSIPGAVLLLFNTPIGAVVHTGDFKLDPQQPDGRLTDEAALSAAGDAGIALLLSDSTSAERAGHTWSEAVVAAHLRERIAQCKNRVLVTTFSSNIFRLKAIVEAAEACGRKVLPVGRSVGFYLGIAIEQDILKPASKTIMKKEAFRDLPPEKVLVLAAGCQGESRSAFGRISRGQDSHILLEPGDTAIMSSRKIPGNERAVGEAINGLTRLGVHIVDDREAHVHTSGHGFAEEQQQMLRLCRPEHFIPVHGELRQLVAHTAMAADVNAHTHLLEDGMGLEFTKDADGVLHTRTLERLSQTSRYADGSAYVNDVVLRDRRFLTEGGFVSSVAHVDEDGAPLGHPIIISRGVVFMDDHTELLGWAEREVVNTLEGLAQHLSDEERSEATRVALRRFFRKELQRRPVIVSVVRTLSL